MAPVCLAGAAAVVVAAITFVQKPHSLSVLLAIFGLFAVMVVAERFPVPIEGVDAGGVTLGFVFAVAAIVLYGWQAGVIVAAAATTVAHLVGRKPLLRSAYNGSMFALCAAASGVVVDQIHGTSTLALIAKIAVCAFLYNWVVNLVLISAVVSANTGKPFLKLIWETARQT
ncbi:MAG TPA: hypothetical protein VID95_07930, partial [Candidatus Limnocylindrales bacterium]